MPKQLLNLDLERDNLQQKWGFTIQGGADLALTAKVASVKVRGVRPSNIVISHLAHAHRVTAQGAAAGAGTGRGHARLVLDGGGYSVCFVICGQSSWSQDTLGHIIRLPGLRYPTPDKFVSRPLE